MPLNTFRPGARPSRGQAIQEGRPSRGQAVQGKAARPGASPSRGQPVQGPARPWEPDRPGGRPSRGQAVQGARPFRGRQAVQGVRPSKEAIPDRPVGEAWQWPPGRSHAACSLPARATRQDNRQGYCAARIPGQDSRQDRLPHDDEFSHDDILKLYFFEKVLSRYPN